MKPLPLNSVAPLAANDNLVSGWHWALAFVLYWLAAVLVPGLA